MKRLSKIILLSFFTLPPLWGGQGWGLKCNAQSVDPALSGMIVAYTEKAKSELKSQERAMLLQTTAHIWTEDEVSSTTSIQKKFNEYLDTFNDIIVYAAQIYGFYHEIDRLVANIGALNEQLGDNAEGAFAAALTPKRNQIYLDIIMNSVEIVNDIRQVCLSKTKMTEQQRVEIVFAIRPKLKKMNVLIRRLTRAVKYSSFASVWAEIDEGSKPKPANKADIAQKAMLRWKQAAK